MSPSTNANKINDDDDALTATLCYSKDVGRRPHVYYRPLSRKDPHKKASEFAYDYIPVQVQNGRKHNLTLDENSFELIQNVPSELTTEDFYAHPEKIISIYYDEIVDLIKKQTGAEEVVAMQHEVRNETRQSQAVKGYSRNVHVDVSPFSAKRIFFDALSRLQKKREKERKATDCEEGKDATNAVFEKYSKGRFVHINCWRNICDDFPVMENHLAVCDETSLVKPDDYIEADAFTRGLGQIPGTHYRLDSSNASQHRWYYFPQTKKSEVIMFKQWDSDPTRNARSCFHTAMNDAPTDEKNHNVSPRESIEVRCIAFFPHHTPNTCPAKPPSVEAPTTLPPDHYLTATTRMVTAVTILHAWPYPLKIWFISKAKANEWDCLLNFLINDKWNYFSLRGASPQVKEAAKAHLQTKLKFEKTATVAVDNVWDKLGSFDRNLVHIWPRMFSVAAMALKVLPLVGVVVLFSHWNKALLL